MSLVACVDFGSTFTKAALVDCSSGELVASASHPTTSGTDVLDGWHACLRELTAAEPRAGDAEVRACSSAGGGLRIAVVGNEELVTAEAGRRVALSSGGRVVHVVSGGLDDAAVSRLHGDQPDVLLLVGGTNGGNLEVLLDCARVLSEHRWPTPVVVAGNVDAKREVTALLDSGHTPYVLADNVVPQIGVLAPASARAAIRKMFLRHVIGGKHLSRTPAFASMVRGPTPDVVLTATELLARIAGAGDVVVVDVGGATTDVHSVVELDPEDAGLARQVVADVPVTRTVEGDLGMRWSAVSTVTEGMAAGVLEAGLAPAADVRRANPAFVPTTRAARHEDERIAAAAVAVALRRHAGRAQVTYGDGGRVLERSGKDLREVDVLVGSGGVLRKAGAVIAGRILRGAVGEQPGGWQLPRDPRVVVDREYVLAPAGLLADDHPQAASRLLQSLLR